LSQTPDHRTAPANERVIAWKMRHAISHQMMLECVRHLKGIAMRTTINLDDALLDRARELSGLKERNALMREALEALIQRETARRLARLGGTQSQLRLPPRRRLKAS